MKRFIKFFAISFFFFVFTIKSTGQVVSTVAGSDIGSNDGIGTLAQFASPRGICGDASGNLYITDTNNHRIRKISADGAVTTFAGSSEGFEDGTGTAAKFSNPLGICIDLQGNLYVSDNGNFKIRKITPEGVVSTFAGSTQGNVIGDLSNAQFMDPRALCFDSNGNLYVVDYNDGLKKISTQGVVSYVVGQVNISALCADTAGNVYYATNNSRNIRKVSSSGEISLYHTVAQISSNEQAGAFIFFSIEGISLDFEENLWISVSAHRIIKKNFNENFGQYIAGGFTNTGAFADGLGNDARFNLPTGLFIDNENNLFIVDTWNNRIRKLSNNPLLIPAKDLLSIEVYPNPTNNELFLKSDKLITAVKAFDTTGKVFSLEIQHDGRIFVEHLAKGLYFLEVFYENRTKHLKFIKN